MTLTNCGNPGPSGRATCLGNCTLHPAPDHRQPSIAELQRIEADPTADFEGAAIRAAAPVLLEIAAAALAYENAGCYESDCDHRDGCVVIEARRTLHAALAKVRP